MATITSTGLSPAESGDRHSGALAGIRTFWREFVAKAFHPYRPEQHYMRGPGPAWRAKYGEAAAFRLTSRNV
jgi:hypothetical protein